MVGVDVDGLRSIVGQAHVLTDPDLVASYVTDWTGRFVGSTPCVVRPGSTADVAAVVARCRSAGVALTLQGGNTGLVGGGVPLAAEVVLSLRRLDSVEVEPAIGQVTAGAGATIGSVQRAAAGAGWAYAVDLASRDSATVGGTIATNAGGLHVIRYGATRAQLLGVEAVLGDGSVVSHLGGLIKDNTGYDLAGLLCGSEGTLGVVTAARLALVAPVAERTVALLAFASRGDAVAAATSLRRTTGESLESVELFIRSGLELVCSVLSLEPPFPAGHAAYVLAEVGCKAGEDGIALLGTAVESLVGVADVALAPSGARRAALWRYREAHTEAIATLGPVHKLDVSVPLDRLAELADRVPEAVNAVAAAAQTWLFGHAGDGNLHVNVTGVAAEDESVDAAVLELVASLGGSISAEHGIGVAKRPWLHLNRTPAELAAMRAIKRALDPDGILNPNVLV